MPLETKPVPRSFSFLAQILPDPNPEWSVEKVRAHYASHTYPSMSNAAIEGPQHVNGSLVYTFKQPVGSKG